MNIRKTVKKIAALAAGTTMIGATIMGATALDLSDYPAPFVADGVFDGKIVVGAEAATSDVVGAIDIAASLQAEATTTTEIDVPGTAGTTTVTGDSAKFQTGTDILGFNELLGGTKQTFTASDLEGLKDGTFDTGLGSSPVKQYLKFDDATPVVDAAVVYAENNEDEVGDFLKFNQSGYLFEYHLDFTEGISSEIGTNNELDDYEGEVLSLLGSPFTIVEAKRGAGNSIELTMLGGEVADVLRDGETQTYTVNGVDYEVTAVFIDSSKTQSAKLSVNGILTKELTEGNTEILGGDVTIGIQDILTNQREGLVEFYLGANKIKFKDSDYTNGAYASETVKVGTNSLGNAQLDIKAANNTANDEVKLSYIKYKIQANDDIFVAPGEGLKEQLYDPESLLTDNWDILYAGLLDTGVTTIKFDPSADDSYNMEFVNFNGQAYDFPLITAEGDDEGGSNDKDEFLFGDDNQKNFIFREPDYTFTNATASYKIEFTASSGAGNVSINGNATAKALLGNASLNGSTFIADDDYFVLSDGTNDGTDNKRVANVLKYQSINTGDKIVTFRDLTGDTIEVSYTGTPGSDARGELIVSGKSHYFWIGPSASTSSRERYALSMDLDGDGGIGVDEVRVVTEAGGIIDFGTQTFDYTNGNQVPLADDGTNDLTLKTLAADFDEGALETNTVRFTHTAATPAVEVSVTSPTLLSIPDEDDYTRAMNRYGAFFELFTPTSSSTSSELTIEYPLVQRGAEVFVTAGTVDVKEGAGTGDGSFDSTDVNPIAVGMAVLDTNAPAVGTENLIVVGGPCANTVAYELMGQPENCAEGFEPGKAMIKLFADQNALLVAGYEAQETLGASYVIADHEDYELTGTEVEVVVADLNTITVNAVEMEE